MKTIHTFIALFLLFALFLPIVSAQDTDKLNLPEGAKLRLGNGTLGEIAYFPDGTRFAVATSVGVWIYDSITGEELYQLTDLANHVKGIENVSISSDGNSIVTGGPDGAILIWKTSTGQLLRYIADEEKAHYNPIFSPDGNIIAISSGTPSEISNKTINLWDVRTGQHLKTLTTCHHLKTLAQPNAGFYNKRFSPDGKIIVIWRYSGRNLDLWDVSTGEHLTTFMAHERSITSVYFSPDGKTIITSGLDKTARLWDANTGELLNTIIQEDTNDFSDACFSPDGKTIATTGSSDGWVRLWDATTRQYLKSLIGHTESKASCVRFSPNGKIIAAAGADGTILLWSATTGQELIKLSGHEGSVDTFSFSPDRITILSKGSDKTVRLWDAITGELLKTLDGYMDDVNSVSFSPDGNMIASGSSDHTVRLWNTSTGELVNTLAGHTDEIFSVCFSPGGKTIASGSRDKTIRLWDINTGEHLKSLKRNDPGISRLYFISDGSIIVSCSWNGTIQLWNVSTGQKLKTVFGELISPDGNIILSVDHGSVEGEDSILYLEDFDTGQHFKEITYTGSLATQSFSPDGKTFAVTDTNNSIVEIWDVKLGKILNSFSGHLSHPYCGGGTITTVRYSASGETIASGSTDKTVRLWNTTTNKHLKTLSGHTGGISSVAFSPDGKTLASGSSDGTILLWNVP